MAKGNTRQRTRQMIRKKLKKWGMPEEDIDRCIKQVAQRQREKELGILPRDAPLCTLGVYVQYLRKQPHATKSEAAVLKLGEDYESPDDKGFKPTKVDAVLNGVARATGQTAKAVKRRKTITKHEHDGGK